MIRNLSVTERWVRIAASIALVIVALLGSYSMLFVGILYLTALLLVVTALLRHCPVYRLHDSIRQRPAPMK